VSKLRRVFERELRAMTDNGATTRTWDYSSQPDPAQDYKSLKPFDAIARVLRDEGIDSLVCYPAQSPDRSVRERRDAPIICRQERTGVHSPTASAARPTAKQIGVFARKAGPESRTLFRRRAIVLGRNTRADHRRSESRPRNTPPSFSAVDNFAHITMDVADRDEPARVYEILRRAFHHLRTQPSVLTRLGGRRGMPIAVSTRTGVAAVRSAPDPRDVEARPMCCSPPKIR